MFPRVAAHTLGHINRNIFRFSVGLRMFPVGIFVHVALVPAWGGWGLSSQGGEYRSRSKNAVCFGKATVEDRQASPRNTEVGARMAATSVNEVFFHKNRSAEARNLASADPSLIRKLASLSNSLYDYRTTPSLKMEISRQPCFSALVCSPLATRSTYSSRRSPASSRDSPSATEPALKSIQPFFFS